MLTTASSPNVANINQKFRLLILSDHQLRCFYLRITNIPYCNININLFLLHQIVHTYTHIVLIMQWRIYCN